MAGGGVCLAGRVCMAGDMHGRGRCGRGMCGWGHMWLGGHVWQGACVVGGGMCGMHATPGYYEIQSVNAWAVRILLECILVLVVCTITHWFNEHETTLLIREWVTQDDFNPMYRNTLAPDNKK